VSDLIASIKVSKMPIICICNDKYKTSLRSLKNYCLELDWRKPTKVQADARLQTIASAEGLAIPKVQLHRPQQRSSSLQQWVAIVQHELATAQHAVLLLHAVVTLSLVGLAVCLSLYVPAPARNRQPSRGLACVCDNGSSTAGAAPKQRRGMRV
jgi:hypothetical protein